MFSYFTLANLSTAVWTIFWGVFYTWAAASIVATIFSTAERAWSNVSYGQGFTRGTLLAAAGLAGVVVGWLVLPLVTGGAPLAPLHSILSGPFNGQKLGLLISILSTLVFNVGVWLALTSENWTTIES